MNINLEARSVTVNYLPDGQMHVSFPVTRTQGDQQETVAVSVTVPLAPSLSLLEIQKVAAQRAIDLLKTAFGTNQ